MSDARIERLRASYTAFATRDSELLLAQYDPDVVWDFGPMAAAASRRIWEGHAGLRDLLDDFAATLADYDVRILELRSHGEGMLVRGAFRAFVAHMPEVGVESTFGQIIEFREGLISRVLNTDDPPPGWEDAAPAA